MFSFITRWRNRRFYQRILREARTAHGARVIQQFVHLGTMEALSEQSLPGVYAESLEDWVKGTEADSFLSYNIFLAIVTSSKFKSLFLR